MQVHAYFLFRTRLLCQLSLGSLSNHDFSHQPQAQAKETISLESAIFCIAVVSLGLINGSHCRTTGFIGDLASSQLNSL